MNHRKITRSLKGHKQIVVDGVRCAETCYQRATRPCPSFRNFFPTLYSLGRFIVGLVDIRMQVILIAGYLLERTTGQATLEEKYERLLTTTTHSDERTERKFDQSRLVRYQGIANTTPLLRTVPIIGDVFALNDLLHHASGGTVPSLSDFMERTTEQFLRYRHRNNALAQLNYGGVCSGLGKVWGIMTMAGQEELFFDAMGKASHSAQSLSESKLTPQQENLLQAVHHLQMRYNLDSVQVNILFGEANEITQSVTITKMQEMQFVLEEDHQYENNLRQMAERSIDLALQHPGQLISTVIRAQRGHVINTLVHEDNGHRVIDYFDTNIGSLRFHDHQKDVCIDSLASLFKFKYHFYFTQGGGRATFVIAAHKLEGVPRQDLRLTIMDDPNHESTSLTRILRT